MPLTAVYRGVTSLASGLLPDAVVERLVIGGSVIIQECEFIRAAAIEVFNRGNLRTTVEMVIWRQHADHQAAHEHRLRHAAAVLGKANLRINFTAEGETASAVLAGAGWRSCAVELTGISSRTQYSIIGGQFSPGTDLLNTDGTPLLNTDDTALENTTAT